MKQVGKVVLNWVKRYISISFVAVVVVSFVLWGAIKMGHTYSTETSFEVIVNEQSAHCTAMVEGTGYQIIRFKYATRNGINVERKEVKLRYPKADSVIIERNSLLKTLTGRYNDIKIASIEEVDKLI